MPLRILELRKEGEHSRSIFLEDADEGGVPFTYEAGQYLTFRFDDLSEKPIVRSYTLSSSPSQQEAIVFTLKEVPGGIVSPYLCQSLQVGHILKARGPMGGFVYRPGRDQKKVVMLAGGSGVTPFVSMMREHVHSEWTQSMKLLVSFTTTKELILWDDLKFLRTFQKIDIQVSLTREKDPQFLEGRISHEMIAKLVKGDFSKTTFYVCGPEGMMQDIVSFLKTQEVPPEDIRLESFQS